jgi:hypothetical protein
MKTILATLILMAMTFQAQACTVYEAQFIGTAQVEELADGLCQVRMEELKQYWAHYRCPVLAEELENGFVVKASDCSSLVDSEGNISGVAVQKSGESFYTIE